MSTPDRKMNGLKPCYVIVEPITPSELKINFSAELKKAINDRNMLTTKTRQKVADALDELDKENNESRRLEKKQKIMKEILESEENYVKQLETIMGFFAKPTREKDLLKAEDRDVLFGNIESIYNINTELLAELRKGPENIAMAFSKIAPFLKVYSCYALDFKKSLQIIQKCQKTDPNFAKFLEMQESRPEVQSKLSALLIAPIQRVPRYRLLLKPLFNLAIPVEPDYEPLADSLKKVEEAAEHINKFIEEQENMQRLIELQRCLQKGEPNLIVPGKKLIKEGRLMRISTYINKKVYTVLVNDTILFFSMKKDDLTVNSLKCWKIFPLNKCTVVPALDKGAFKLECLNEEVYLFHEELEEIKDWIQELQEAIKNHMDDRRTLRKENSARRPVKRKDMNEYNDVGISPGQKLKKRKLSYQEEEDNVPTPAILSARRPLRSSSQQRTVTFQAPLETPSPPSTLTPLEVKEQPTVIDTNGAAKDVFVFGAENKDRGFKFRMGQWLSTIGSTVKRFFGFK